MHVSSDLPRWLVGCGWLALALFTLPTISLLTQASWGSFFTISSDHVVLDALWLSMVVSFTSAFCAGVLGLPLAVMLTSMPTRLAASVRSIILVPLVLPPVATGVGLLAAFGRQGIAGKLFGFGLSNTTAGAILASTIVSMPFLVLSVEGAIRTADEEFRDAAATLGASPGRQLRHVTLPLTKRAVVAGLVLAWARSLGEFGATITFAGNIQGVTRTLPLQIALSLEQDRDQALMLSVIMVLISLLVMVVLRRGWAGAFSARR